MASKNPNLRVENMNPCVKEMEYAVRGPLVIRATALQGEMDQVRLSSPSTLHADSHGVTVAELQS